MPEIVNDRMLKRIIAFSGIPVFVGFSLFPFFYFLKVTYLSGQLSNLALSYPVVALRDFDTSQRCTCFLELWVALCNTMLEGLACNY